MGYVWPPTSNGGALPTNERLIYDRALPAVPASVGRVRRELEAALGSPVRVADVALVASEAATNVVLHAYEPLLPGLLLVDAAFTGADLRLRVRDCGRGLNGSSERPGLGVGLLLMTRFADSFEISGHPGRVGTLVEATFRDIAPAAEAGSVRRPATEEFDDYVSALAAWHEDDAHDVRAVARHALHDADRLRAER